MNRIDLLKDDLKITYENNLDTEKFARMFNSTSQSYKFYWLEAIINLLKNDSDEMTFDEIIDEMICDAWYTVTHFHLHLGPSINGNAENFLEHAIITLNDNVKLISSVPSKEEIKAGIKNCNDVLKDDKKRLTDYVPYRLLSPFFDTENLHEGLSYIKKDQNARLISYMERLSDKENIFYRILPGKELNKRVKMNKYWKKFVLDNFKVIESWIQFNKAQFLQNRNPGVPGIVNKLYYESDDKRKLEATRDLWKTTAKITGNPIKEIYTGKELLTDTISIDHFVPRSYISNDELWNLIPMSKSLNSSKNNKLPLWDDFFKPFAEYQFYLYSLVFKNENDILKSKFNKCKVNNLNAIWANESLYVRDNSRDTFINILEHNLRPIYDSALLQGYDIWNI